RQLRLSARTKVLEQLRPRREASLADDTFQLRPQVDVALPVAGNAVDRAIGGQLESLFKVRSQLGKDRHGPDAGLWRVNPESGTRPINVGPLQGQNLARAA